MCGDPSGVEVWEWFDALQCWIEKEILPAEKLISLDDSCGAQAPAPEEGESLEDILDPAASQTDVPAQINVVMGRKSLVVGEEEEIKIYPLNSKGESIYGYIEDPVHLELTNPNTGEFDKNDFNIFSGEETVKFKANNIGSTAVKITMGKLEYTFSIGIYTSVTALFSADKKTEDGQNIYEISVSLRDPSNNPLSDINTDLVIGPVKPLDGKFEKNGKMEIINGNGKIKFYPNPGPTEIKLTVKDEYYSSDPFSIYPPPGLPVTLALKIPKYIPVGGTVNIPVTAVDINSNVVSNFNNKISISLQEDTKDYANVLTPTVTLNKGKGTIKLSAGKQSGEIQLIAKYTGLKDGVANIPLLARMESSEWAKIYPQNLVASLIGFPAGDFTQEGYFGGVHLFNGKTEAVFSSMKEATPPPILTVGTNNNISILDNTFGVLADFPRNKIYLQAYNLTTFQTIIAKTIPLNFKELAEWGDNTQPAEDTMYLEVLNDSYKTIKTKNGLELRDLKNKPILKLATNNISLPNTSYSLTYNTQPEFDTIELLLTNGFEDIARVILSFKRVTQNPENFDEINDAYAVDKIFGGKSTKDATGLVVYNPRAEVQKEELPEYYGFEGDNKYLKLFGGGSPIGEAVQYNLPPSGILLGDPTIKLNTKTLSTNFDASIGRKIFQDPEGIPIVSINQFDFNNDDYKDVVMIMKDGRVRLMEGGPTDPILKDRGDIAFLADGAIAVERFDFKKDGYEDILVATQEGRLAILNNDSEVLTRTDQQIKVGKKLYTLVKGDMDDDGYEDLVTLDSKGDIRIFYYDGEKFSENGKFIANYGFHVKTGENLYKDLDIRYPGLDTPGTGFAGIDMSAIPKVTLPTPSIEPSSSQSDALEKFSSGDVSEPSDATKQAMYDALEKMAEEARKDPVAAVNAGTVPLLPWPEANDTETKSDDELETYFAPAEDVDFVHITKSVSNKERPRATDLDLEENLLYKIEIKSDINKNNVVLADTVPDSLVVDPKTAVCEGTDCGLFAAEQKSIRLFFSGLNLREGQTITITYEATVKNTPKAGFYIKRLTKPANIEDRFLDIVVSPPYNNTGDYIQHYTVGARDYEKRSTTTDVKVQTNTTTKIAKAFEKNKETIAALEDFALNVNGDTDVKEVPVPDGTCEVVNEAIGSSGGCYESAESTYGCANEFLDDVAGAINDFACMGGGCFPIPWNFTFLVPPQMPLPLFAFPAGPGPYPMPGFLAMPGAAAVTGTYNSMIRFYLGFSLTGGIGIGMCWGPYMGSSTAPTPVFPIPYPPPIGNCMVVALPMGELPVCKEIEKGVTWLVEKINAGIDKINSAADSVNDQDLPVEMTQGNSEEGAGGLEISLGVNLGESMKFDPPAKSFSNVHIPTMDSLMGKISGWFDRQTLEILNKLFTLPTFYIYLPDFKSLFTLDIDRTEKQFTQWINVISKSPGETSKTLSEITAGGKDKKFGGDDLLNWGTAVESQFRTYNLNLFQGLYDVVNSLPLVQLTENPIEFKVPWLSMAEIRAYIIELQKWALYYKREINRVKDLWEKYTCDASDAAGASECAVRKVADAFLVNFDPVLESVQKNIEVLQSYLAFPRQFVKFRSQLVDYIRGVACYVNVIANMLGGYENKLREQVISWAELIATIIEIVKNWTKLFDLFINFDTTCSICTNERYANFGWWMLLGLILPDIPIISFPKWPDIVLDLSDMSAAVNIEIPMPHLVAEPIPLPKLPYLRLPDIPSINLLLQFPPLPILPSLPAFPDLPKLPPIPTVNLPGLPAPPKLPDIGIAFKIIIEIIEKILKIWCLVKKSLAPIPESMLNDQITLITNRPAYITPLDLIKIQLPNVALFDLGFNELRLEVKIYLGLRIKLISQAMQEAADQFNEWTGKVPEFMREQVNKSFSEMEQYLQSKLDEIQALMDKAAQSVEEGAAEGTDMSRIEPKDTDKYFSYDTSPVETEQPPKEMDEIKDLFGKMIAVIEKTNKSELVDVKTIKEQLGVSDIAMDLEQTSVNKMKWMQKELLAYSDTMEAENKKMENTDDLNALAQVPPRELMEYELASENYAPITEDSGNRVYTNAVIPTTIPDSNGATIDSTGAERLGPRSDSDRPTSGGQTYEATATETTTGSSAESENTGDSGYCDGLCLPDPVTNDPVPFIPRVENYALSETVFLDNGNVVYSDGSSLYFKKNKVLLPPLVNTGRDVPDEPFILDDKFMSKLGQAPYLMEAVNMLRTGLAESGSSSFTWKASTNPNLYGYGIEMERSILGFDPDKQENGLPDVKFVLLPPDENNNAPEAIVDDTTVIPYGTLVTSMKDAEAAQSYFGIKSDNVITGAKKITFKTIGNATIKVGDNTALYFDKFAASSYSVNMENGFYHIKMTWFDKYGRVATYNHNELLYPQMYADAAPPIDMSLDKEYYVPVYKEKVIKASTIFMDLSRAYKYYWYVDVEKNPVTPVPGNILTIPPQPEPKEFLVKLVASKDIKDASFQKYEKTFKVIVYVPKITLEKDPLQDGTIKGTLAKLPKAKDDNLSDIPFSIFRKRWDTWKNLGLLISKKGTKTDPQLNDNKGRKYVYNDSYYTFADAGQYEIKGFDLTYPSPVMLKDAEGKDIAKVDPRYGRIELLEDGYKISAVPASKTEPTRITVSKADTGGIMASVYYVSDANTDVSIKETALGVKDIEKIGVTIGDANSSDDIIAKNIPGFAPSMPGGAIIYKQTPPQNVIALVDTNGSVRIMRAGYELRIKNEGAKDEPYIFQIAEKDGGAVFDVYIQADFGKMNIDTGKPMSGGETTLGMTEATERMFAPSMPKPAAEENPFPDLDTAHPYYKQILELYKRRVISGYGDGTFKPDAKITRAEFIKIALGVTNCFDCSNPTDPQREKYTPVIPFPDVRLPAWYYFCIWIAKELGMITGYGDGFFRPEINISRAEAAAVLLRQSGIKIDVAPEGAFADVPDYAWYKDYVFTAVNMGLIKQTAGFVFPDEQITRGEFAFMGMGVINMQDCREVDSDGDGMPDWWEMENNLNPLSAADAASDYDFDGLTALQEYNMGTDPNKLDTDGDGIPDGQDKTPLGEGILPPEEGAVCPCADNPNQNDSDMDGTIDACDTDLDADGILNALCIFDDSGIVDAAKIAASADNCVFNPNPDQADSDFNKVGDICEPLDECPTIPEDVDGVDDLDGCPDVDDELPDTDPGVYVNKGEECGFADYEADLMDGDIIMTAITDVNTHEMLYEVSNEVEYSSK
jgi:hypothetical protein